MSGRWIKRAAEAHTCSPPDISKVVDAHMGDEWLCDECRGVFVIHKNQDGDLVWSSDRPVRYDRHVHHPNQDTEFG